MTTEGDQSKAAEREPTAAEKAAAVQTIKLVKKMLRGDPKHVDAIQALIDRSAVADIQRTVVAARSVVRLQSQVSVQANSAVVKWVRQAQVVAAQHRELAELVSGTKGVTMSVSGVAPRPVGEFEGSVAATSAPGEPDSLPLVSGLPALTGRQLVVVLGLVTASHSYFMDLRDSDAIDRAALVVLLAVLVLISSYRPDPDDTD